MDFVGYWNQLKVLSFQVGGCERATNLIPAAAQAYTRTGQVTESYATQSSSVA